MTNRYQTIDRRQRLACACNCGLEATLDKLRVVEIGARKALVLPGCEGRFREEMAARRHLREIVMRPAGLLYRVRHVREVYRLQRLLCERNGSRKTAWRTAIIYLLGQRLGLWVAAFWRKVGGCGF